MTKKSKLLSSYQLTAQLELKNRIVMAPMTRSKADDDLTPTQEMATYYARRADAGLIITEGVVISKDASGYPNVPGIYNQPQIDAWRQVTNAVHQQAGHIFMQIWHVGRVSHPIFLEGALPVSASETTMSGKVRRSNELFYGKSRAATQEDIQQLVQDYVTAAKNAIAAGFDGVEIHGANGYLIDQFLHYDTNKRTDDYGGTPENMARFALEVTQAIGEAIGFQKVGIRLSPGAYLNEIVGDDRDKDVFVYLLKQLNNLPIAYVHTGNFDDTVLFKELERLTMTQFMKMHYTGSLIASGGYEFSNAEDGVSRKAFDLVAMGRPFIANPDLITKFQEQAALKQYDSAMLGALH